MWRWSMQKKNEDSPATVAKPVKELLPVDPLMAEKTVAASPAPKSHGL